MPALLNHSASYRSSSPSRDKVDPSRPSPQLPSELLAYIIELAFFSASPAQLPPSFCHKHATTTSSSSSRTEWDARTNLLLVSRLFHVLARPHLYHTISLNSDRAAERYFAHLLSHPDGPDLFAHLDRAWFGNVSAAQRDGYPIDPVQHQLREAAWYEETAGGFIVGHSYASRPRLPRQKKKKTLGARPRAMRRVSVYWAEEEILEEISDPGSEDDSHEDDGQVGEAQDQGRDRSEGPGGARHRESPPAWQTLYASSRRTRSVRDQGHRPDFQPRRRVAMSATLSGPVEGELDPWDMVEAQERLSSQSVSALPMTVTRSNNGSDLATSTSSSSSSSGSAVSSNAGSFHEPQRWGRQQPPTVQNLGISRRSSSSSSSLSPSSSPSRCVGRRAHTTIDKLAEHRFQRRRQLHPHQAPREIYAYHLVTTTLENWINRMLSEIRTLQYITITFYPGSLLDDDKLEHVLRRILSADENPKLEQLLIRIAHEPAAAGSRVRRLDRAMTIGGAVDRIGDERIRIEGLSPTVGGGTLSPIPSSLEPASGHSRPHEDPCGSSDEVHRSPNGSRPSSPSGRTSRSASPRGLPTPDSMQRLGETSRRAVLITRDGWWSRILSQNRARSSRSYSPTAPASTSAAIQERPRSQVLTANPDATEEAAEAQRTLPERGPDAVEPFSSIFGPEHARTLRAILELSNPFPDDPIPLEPLFSRNGRGPGRVVD